jgi:hypothetical protein
MSTQTKREVLAKLRARYARAGHDYKTQILDQVDRPAFLCCCSLRRCIGGPGH